MDQNEDEEQDYHGNSHGKNVAIMNKKNLNRFDKMHQKNKMSNFQSMEPSTQNKMFRIEKVGNKKDSSQESFFNNPSEEQKQMENNYPFMNRKSKSMKNSSEGDSNTSTAMNYICLSSGQILIKGNEVETNVHCNIETLNNKVTMISPQGPVKIVITPLLTNQSLGYDSKSKNSFELADRKASTISSTKSLNELSKMMNILDSNY